MEQNIKSRMKYLVPRTDGTTLDVWLNKRDWDDMHDERHYEYHVQTARNMAGNLDVVVHANDAPWTIMLHGTLLLRLLKSRAVKSIVINKAAWHGPVRALSYIMWPGLPADVKTKITFASL